MESPLSDNFATSVAPSCGEARCNSRGTCVLPPDGGNDLRCDCKLGYQGNFCEQTVHGSLSVSLTLSILSILLFLVTLAFVLAKLRRRKKKADWRNAAIQLSRAGKPSNLR